MVSVSLCLTNLLSYALIAEHDLKQILLAELLLNLIMYLLDGSPALSKEEPENISGWWDGGPTGAPA